MKKPFLEIDPENFSLSQFETHPIKGYSPPKNKESGDVLPNCCDFHRDVFNQSSEWFEKFPNCCESHKKFIGKWWFDKNNYSGIVLKIVNQLSYTEYHVRHQISREDWYKDITDYIEYNVSSFGHPAVGLNEYLRSLRHSIEHSASEIEPKKKVKLLEYIDSFYKENIQPPPDLNLLHQTYQQWLHLFPFELNSYFGNLKAHYSSTLPILKEKPTFNRYTGMAKASVHTKETLMTTLTDLTDKLLTQVNGSTLYEQGLITDANAIKLDLVVNARKQKLKSGYQYNSTDENTQIKRMIKYWFDDEKKFIDEITPLLNKHTESQMQADGIDWLRIFEELDLDAKIPVNAYRTTTVDEKKRYFNKASFKLTLQYLLRLKKEIYLLSNNRKLDFLRVMDIKPPKGGTSENPELNQVAFEAQRNYFEFITSYMIKLEQETGTAETDKSTQPAPGFNGIFKIANWEKYVDALVLCDPPLINSSYEFIGNTKKHRGVVSAWFKFLKSKGIVDQSLNRQELARLLTASIKNYSISPSSVDNKSGLYESHFEKQLRKSCNL
jgi:hypothetical protein